MRILFRLSPATNVPPDVVKSHAVAENRAVWVLYRSDKLREMYFRTDRPGAVFMIEAHTLDAAKQLLATLPMVAEGLRVPGAPTYDRALHGRSSPEVRCEQKIAEPLTQSEGRFFSFDCGRIEGATTAPYASKKPASSSRRCRRAASGSMSRPRPGPGRRSTIESLTIRPEGRPVTISSHQGSEALGYSKAM
jgi:hypothetical protein